VGDQDIDGRVLVTRAGTGASNNLIRGLRAGAPDLVVIGCHSDRFFLRRSQATRNYLIPSLDHAGLAAALRFAAAKERIDLIIPTTDADVRAVSDLRASLPCRVFLPAPSTIELMAGRCCSRQRNGCRTSGGGPSGVSSIGGIHKTVREPGVVRVCLDAVRAADPSASGAFSIDLKEDGEGRPCVTAINVGRFLTGSPIFDLTGKHNMTATYVRLAMDLPVQIDEVYDVAEDYYMIRDLDLPPEIVHADALSDGIEDARVPSSKKRARR